MTPPQPTLEHLLTQWQSEFPQNTHLLSTLRYNLALAELSLQHAQLAFLQLRQQLDATGPMYSWEPELLTTYLLLRHNQSFAQHEFRRALHTLQTAHSTHLLAEKLKSETPAPPLMPQFRPIPIRQNIKIEMENGELTTEIDLTAENVWNGQPWPENTPFWRDFYFPDALIPDAYAWVLTHEDVTHQPTHHISILYSQQEFLRLCKLEIDTQSPFVLDGERLHATRKD